MAIRPDFVNHRLPGEDFKAYRARLKSVARSIRLYLRGGRPRPQTRDRHGVLVPHRKYSAGRDRKEWRQMHRIAERLFA